MKRVEINLSDDTFAILDRDAIQLAAEPRAAAAVKWFEVGRVSLEVAVQVAGVSSCEFAFVLSYFKGSPLQNSAGEAASIQEFRKLRCKLTPLAQARGIHTDEDVFCTLDETLAAP